MTSILSNTFIYNNTREVFMNDNLLCCYPDNCNIDTSYKFLTLDLSTKCLTFDNHDNEDCTMCRSEIKGDMYQIANDMKFHPICMAIIERMINLDQLHFITIILGNTIRRIPVYGYIFDTNNIEYAVACEGSFIERWKWYLDVPREYNNIYEYISDKYSVSDTITCNLRCDNCSCFINGPTTYIYDVVRYCTACYYARKKFTSNLITKYMLISSYLVDDIGLIITKQIIDINNMFMWE